MFQPQLHIVVNIYQVVYSSVVNLFLNLVWIRENVLQFFSQSLVDDVCDNTLIAMSLNIDKEAIVPRVHLHLQWKAKRQVSNPHSIFMFLPILSFTESYIYQVRLNCPKHMQKTSQLSSLSLLMFSPCLQQLDIINEKSLHSSFDKMNTSGNYMHATNSTNHWVGTRYSANNLPTAFVPNAFDPLCFLLLQQGLLTKLYSFPLIKNLVVPCICAYRSLLKFSSMFCLIRIQEELETGLEYWALERKLCHALTSRKKILLEDVMRAIHLKSFDYRVLHLLLCQLRGEQDDVIENSFNVLRMFVRIYGPQMAPSMLVSSATCLRVCKYLLVILWYSLRAPLTAKVQIPFYYMAKCISEAEVKYELLLAALDSDLSSSYQRRCEEATREGGKTSGYTLGTWNIPSVIADEDAYRSRIRNSNAGGH
ncbi:hypothetical protein Taro_044535 [Colocasia esculenta]|uniref:Uncharacterized protein n=1 Tax=Colocasia esculenta TaxID=4460 RepID=A0A843X3F6_COLES|nr:hypothetical protein [Colocasia esculenta]